MPAQVILAFANDTSGSLQSLQRENNAIYSYLNKMNKNLINAIQKPSVTIDSLMEEFQARQDDLAIFHFSGHAGQFDLLFADGRAVDGRGIAGLTKYTPRIELVFLNGCATKDLIDSFHQAGVKRVIATSRKVYDNVASEFAIKFYSSLSQFSTIREAFDYAKDYMVLAKQEPGSDKVSSRHISTTRLRESDEFPYAIYYKPIVNDGQINENFADYEKYEDWTIEDKEPVELPYTPCVDLLCCIGEKGRALRDHLINSHPDAKKIYKEEILAFTDLYRSFTTFQNGAQNILHAGDLSNKLIGLLPRPLGIIMRQMITSAKDIAKNPATYYKELLKYQLRFYDVLLKFCCFTMLSDLYEALEKRNTGQHQIYFDRDTLRQILQLLSLRESNVINFNYRELIGRIRQKILDNEGTPFVVEDPESEQHIADELQIAHEIITIKKIQFRDNRLHSGMASHCMAVEEELCKIMKEVYFIMRYNLLVIRNIEAIRVRFRLARGYQHRIMLLKLGISSDYAEYELTNEQDYTENYSVILAKGVKNIADYLSLSPFVIDKCALTNDDSSQLFYYSHFNNGVLVYEGVEDAREKIEIEVRERDEEQDDEDGMPTLVKVKYIPYVESLVAKDPNLNRAKLNIRLMMIYEQFTFFREKMEKLNYIVK